MRWWKKPNINIDKNADNIEHIGRRFAAIFFTKVFYTNFRERVGSAWHAGSIDNVHTQINSGGSSRGRGGLVISGEEIQALQTLVSSSTTVRGITIWSKMFHFCLKLCVNGFLLSFDSQLSNSTTKLSNYLTWIQIHLQLLYWWKHMKIMGLWNQWCIISYSHTKLGDVKFLPLDELCHKFW